MDTRIARWWSNDPVFQPHQSPYSLMDGNPVLLSDPRGDKTDDKFYDETGKLLHDDGAGDGLYVVSNVYFQLASKTFNLSGDKLSNALRSSGKKAYSSEIEAVYDWSIANAKVTRDDPQHIERAVNIYRADTKLDKDLPYIYIYGTTSVGRPAQPRYGIKGSVDINASGLPNIGAGSLNLFKNFWTNTAAAHTHPPGADEFSGAMYDNIYDRWDGDKGYVMTTKKPLYLATTTHEYPDIKKMDSEFYYLSQTIFSHRGHWRRNEKERAEELKEVAKKGPEKAKP